MSNLTSHHVLFYSKKCQHCKELYELMTSMNLWNDFVNICVEETRNLPKSVKSVPTIIVPSHKNPLEGEEVFMWIKSYGNTLNNSKKQESKESNVQSNMEESGDIQAFYGSEYGGAISDKFSYIGDMEGKPLQHQYEFIDDTYSSNNNNVMNTTSVSSNDSKNQKNSEMDNAYNQLLQSRNSDINIGKPLERN